MYNVYTKINLKIKYKKKKMTKNCSGFNNKFIKILYFLVIKFYL